MCVDVRYTNTNAPFDVCASIPPLGDDAPTNTYRRH
jgi:hypothetical protein